MTSPFQRKRTPMTALDRATTRRFHQYQSMTRTILAFGWAMRDVARRERMRLAETLREPWQLDGSSAQHAKRCIERARANAPWPAPSGVINSEGEFR